MLTFFETSDWSDTIAYYPPLGTFGYLQPGYAVTGSVDAAGSDAGDLIRVPLANMFSYGFTVTADPGVTVNLVDDLGDVLATGSRFTYDPFHPSDFYFIQVVGTGSYTVAMDGVAADYMPDEDPGGFDFAEYIQLGGAVAGIINGNETTEDIDYYTFTANAGDTISFQYSPSDSAFGPTAGGQMLLYDAMGAEVFGVSWSASAWDTGANLSYTVMASNTYTLSAATYGFNNSGTYVIETSIDGLPLVPQVSLAAATLLQGGDQYFEQVSLALSAPRAEDTLVELAIRAFSADSLVAPVVMTHLVTIAAGQTMLDTIFGVGLASALPGVDRFQISVNEVHGAGLVADAAFSGVQSVADAGVGPLHENGTTGNDTMIGSAFDDQLSGLEGDDRLVGGFGDDTLNGDAGNDTLIGGTDQDVLNGGTHHDSLDGQQGDDLLNGDAGMDTLIGGLGNDTLNGGDLNDTLRGDNGNDVLDGGGGDDRIVGGNDGDVAYGRLGDDLIYGGQGYDTLYGLLGDDTLYGGLGNDRLFGGVGDDSLIGYDQNDTLVGDWGNDFLDGGTGDDWMNGGGDADYLVGRTGNDTIFGGEGNDTLIGQLGNDTIYSGWGMDHAYGGEGDDEIWGGNQDDTLDGGDGADTLVGGMAQDELIGGAGSDLFVFFDLDGNDAILDFDALDPDEKIDLRGVTAITGLADLNLADPHAGGAQQWAANVVIYTGGPGMLSNSVTLIGVQIADLDASDFIF